MKKLRDPSEEIRQYCVEKIVDFADSDLSLLSKDALEEIGERVKDKRFEVRRATICGLAKIYYNHVSSKLLPLSNEFTTFAVSAKNCDSEVLSKLKFIPSLVLKSWGFPEFMSKLTVIKCLQELILPGRLRDIDDDINGRRASALLLMYSSIDQTDLIIFKNVLAFKSKVRDELSKFVIKKKDQIMKTKNTTQSMPVELESTLKTCLLALAQNVPVVDTKLQVLDKLAATK